MRAILAVACALMLGACNAVMSEKPLVAAADEDPAAPLRDGLWVQVGEICPPNPAPDSACSRGAFVVRRGHLLAARRMDDPHPYRLAAGEPRILQAPVEVRDGKTMHFFWAVKPIKSDDQGRIVAAEGWPVQCGPPHKTGQAVRPLNDYLTHAPIRGVKLDRKLGGCGAKDIALVRQAALASREWTAQPAVFQWLIDDTH